MMRLFFALLLCVAAFVGLALRVARESDSGRLGSLKHTAEALRAFDLRDPLASLVKEPPQPAPASEAPAAPQAAPAAQTAVLPTRPAPAPAAPAPGPAQPAASPASGQASAPQVEPALPPSRALDFRESELPPAASPAAGAEDAPPPAPDSSQIAAASPDEDAWGALLRRMVSVYRRVGEPR